jgi:hypothetical protein
LSFGEWKAFADRDHWQHRPGVELHIRREIAPNQYEVVHGDLIATRVEVPEGAMGPQGSDYPVIFQEEMAKAVYDALHRLYGHENPDGKIEALQESLNVERSRVNALLQGVLTPQNNPMHSPAHQVG